MRLVRQAPWWRSETLHPLIPACEPLKKSKVLHAADDGTRTLQQPLMPAHAGIQLSPRRRMSLKNLDSRLRGNERNWVGLLLSVAEETPEPA